jgi:cation diffusion facilitator family transporter
MRITRLYTQDQNRAALFRKALTVTLLGNIVLAACKLFVAFTGNSAAIMADGLNSASDVFYSAMMVLGFWVSQQPPDKSHPQGHSRFEPLVGLMITLAMAFAAYQAVAQSIVRFKDPQPVDPISSLVLVFSAVVKVGMYFVIRRIAVQTNNPTLRTTAVDNLSDVFTTAGAFVGTIGSTLIHPLTDPIAGILVGILIARNAFNAARENFHFMLGGGADEATIERIAEIVKSVPDVLELHVLCVDYVGPKLVVDMHVNCDATLPLSRVHEIETQIIENVKTVDDVDRVYVHIEPPGLYND